jgi:fibronectin type 3 domain-containing protein
MKKNSTRFLSFLLAFVMVIGLMPVTALATELPQADLGLTVTARYMTNRLSWNAQSGVSYNVERSEDNQSWQQIGTAATGSYLDETADMGTQYFYRVTTDTTCSDGVQGAVTGMDALKQIAVLF